MLLLLPGVIATFVMDAGNLASTRLEWTSGINLNVIARIVYGWADGRFLHASPSELAVLPVYEAGIGRAVHYLTGILFTLPLLDAYRKGKRLHPSVLIGYGILTSVVSLLWLFPSIGIYPLENPLILRTSLINHLFYGIGLIPGFWVLSLRRAHAGP